jgi:hypothetical protein
LAINRQAFFIGFCKLFCQRLAKTKTFPYLCTAILQPTNQNFMINAAALFPSFSRCLDIALLSGYCLDVYANLEEYPNAIADLKFLYSKVGLSAKGYNYFRADYKKAKNMCIELTKPEKYIVKSDAITFDEKVASVIKQLKENDNKFLADADLVISGSVEAFVNVAVERVGLSLLDLETAFRISKTIALSGGSKTVAAIDIAEALQYVSARHGKNLEYIGTI